MFHVLLTFLLQETVLIWGYWTLPERDRNGASGPEDNRSGVVGDHVAETLHQELVIDDVMLIDILIDWKPDTDCDLIDICQQSCLSMLAQQLLMLYFYKDCENIWRKVMAT